MKNSHFSALAHPVTLVALLVVLVNALSLQPGDPSWWTGKISDAAWMVVAPLVIASFLSFLAPDRSRRGLGLSGILAVGVTFSTIKTVPSLNHLVVDLYFILFHIPLKLALDPSDLLVLPFLGLAWVVWNHRLNWSGGRWIRAGVLTLTVLALIADSPAPQNLGFTCLIAKDNRVYAFRESLYKAYFSGDQSIIWLYYSTDGGLTWTRDDQALDTKKETCTPQIGWPLSSSNATELEFYFVPGKGLYSSQDNGKTLVFGQQVNQVTSTYQDPATGNVIFTAGREGVILYTPDGKWQVTLRDTEY